MRINEIFDSIPIIETPRLLLRKLGVEDAEEYFSIASNPLAAKHTIWNAHITIEDSISYLSELQAKMDQGQAIQKMYAILNSDFNELHEEALGHI